jgi:hypothetical protein
MVYKMGSTLLFHSPFPLGDFIISPRPVGSFPFTNTLFTDPMSLIIASPIGMGTPAAVVSPSRRVLLIISLLVISFIFIEQGVLLGEIPTILGVPGLALSVRGLIISWAPPKVRTARPSTCWYVEVGPTDVEYTTSVSGSFSLLEDLREDGGGSSVGDSDDLWRPAAHASLYDLRTLLGTAGGKKVYAEMGACDAASTLAAVLLHTLPTAAASFTTAGTEERIQALSAANIQQSAYTEVRGPVITSASLQALQEWAASSRPLGEEHGGLVNLLVLCDDAAASGAGLAASSFLALVVGMVAPDGFLVIDTSRSWAQATSPLVTSLAKILPGGDFSHFGTIGPSLVVVRRNGGPLTTGSCLPPPLDLPLSPAILNAQDARALNGGSIYPYPEAVALSETVANSINPNQPPPFFGIVVSTYQRRSGRSPYFLRRLLSSLKNQTMTSFRVYLVGDSYTNETELRTVVTEAELSNGTVVIFNLPEPGERNKGLSRESLWRIGGSMALNVAADMALAAGHPWLLHLDDDEWWAERRLEKVFALLRVSPGAVFAFTAHKYTPRAEDTWPFGYLELRGAFPRNAVPKEVNIIHSSMCIRADLAHSFRYPGFIPGQKEDMSEPGDISLIKHTQLVLREVPDVYSILLPELLGYRDAEGDVRSGKDGG